MKHHCSGFLNIRAPPIPDTGFPFSPPTTSGDTPKHQPPQTNMHPTATTTASLYYREGSSNKVYQAAIEPKDDGFIVTYAYGRRGNTLTTGTKTDVLVPLTTATRLFDKVGTYEELKLEGVEGVVFKDIDAPFTPGRPNSGGPQLKFKFVESASFVVLARNPQRSVTLGLYPAGGDSPVPAGNVTIPPNHEVPAPDDVVEIKKRHLKDLGPLHPAATTTVESFLRCGDLASGFTRLQCPDCGHERLLAFTCKVRHFCPSCHQRRVRSTSDWIATAVCHEVPHRQFVFTIPKDLRGIFRKRRQLLTHLFHTATETLRDAFRIRLKLPDGKLGAIAPVHTFG